MKKSILLLIAFLSFTGFKNANGQRLLCDSICNLMKSIDYNYDKKEHNIK